MGAKVVTSSEFVTNMVKSHDVISLYSHTLKLKRDTHAMECLSAFPTWLCSYRNSHFGRWHIWIIYFIKALSFAKMAIFPFRIFWKCSIWLSVCGGNKDDCFVYFSHIKSVHPKFNILVIKIKYVILFFKFQNSHIWHIFQSVDFVVVLPKLSLSRLFSDCAVCMHIWLLQ